MALVVLALVSITGGIVTIVGGATAGHAPLHRAVLPTIHAPRRPSHTVLQVAPIVIPPAPSTTTTSPPPPPRAAAPAVTNAPRGRGVPAGWRRYVSSAVLPRANSAATNVVDPSVVATALVHTLPLYATPGAARPAQTLPSPNYLGATVVLLVTGSQPNWVEAYIPIRPNETTAWIPAADVAVSLVHVHLVVHLGAKTITLYRDNAPVVTYPVATGASWAPTPTGSFFVAYMVKVTDPGGPYGPYALGTSDFSNTYHSFDGGPGQIGIHGTDQPWVIGSAASHGCVRLYDADIAKLAPLVVPGTPVEVEN